MSATAAALDPAEAISAAMSELFEQLEKIVQRGPTDDPSLLDELGKLTGRIRSRITRAKKRAAADAKPKPAEKPTSAVPLVKPVDPTPAAHRAGRVTAKLATSASPHRPVVEQPRGRRREPHLPQLLVVALILLAAVLIAVTGNPLVVLGVAVVHLARAAGPWALRRFRSGGAW